MAINSEKKPMLFENCEEGGGEGLRHPQAFKEEFDNFLARDPWYAYPEVIEAIAAADGNLSEAFANLPVSKRERIVRNSDNGRANHLEALYEEKKRQEGLSNA